MLALLTMNPFVRVAHFYQFSFFKNASESNRIGYCYAFHLIDAGKGTVTIADQSFPVKKGDLLYIPPELPHAFYSDPSHPLASYNIYCELWSAEPLITKIHLVWAPTQFDPTLLTMVKLDTELEKLPNFIQLQHHVTIIELFAQIVRHYENHEHYASEIANTLLKAFIMQLVQLNSQSSHMDYRIKPIIERIDREANLGSHYEDWLEESRLGKTQFHELFKLATGLSPKAYWTKAIMKQASVILWESNQSITSIAENLGYSSIHHFTKQFSAFYGVSPSEFRKRKL
ncbi:helix-turn-helix domain-containing protein [Paenibacillus psychroresistens]|uniref:Helix-turn-helix domain-containing protein n=1 Tax=Paenibacillus psychroresistens TaxID=1778678 RepID=A0A6B8RLD7_9BACL|nr:helix-turn-helix domain-containing protein [Paenibacillus psychroresistens]QGQ97201.1 helix-turn-helix domain-containing protein [Paenibacillus psychroresistens]